MADSAPIAGTDIQVCRSPEAAKIVREYLRGAAGIILDALGEESVAAIAVSGSATLGEMTALTLEDEGPLVLSDVDLAVITKNDSQRARAKSLRPVLLKRSGSLPQAGAILAPAELGVYSLRDLEVQAPKMGVLEMRESGRVLWGDHGVLKALPNFGPDEIPKREALALLYNRCLERLHALCSSVSNEPRSALRLLYAGVKSFLDAGTALTAFHGRYVPGYARRLPAIETTLSECYPGGLGTLGSDALKEGFSFWTRFKVAPDLAEVAGRYGCGVDGRGLAEAARRALAESRLPLAETWMALVKASGIGPSRGVLGTCRSLLGSEPPIERLRGWKRLVMAGEIPAARAMRLARAGSPVHLLRVSAFCALDEPWGEDMALSPEARSFLEAYFPVPIRPAEESAESAPWRSHIVEVWKKWTERFWS